MKLVIIGGHLSPALAVIGALPKDTQIIFIGRKYALEGDRALSLEYKTINSLNIPFANIRTGRLQRIFTRYTIPSLLKIPYGFVQALSILRNFKPDVVLGFGGYLSLPVGFAACFMRIPLIIHEQTLEVGAANKILTFFAKRICISWDSSRRFFPKSKTVLTGNPIGKFKVTKKNNKLPLIYITGGSSGSHFINVLVEGCLKELLERFRIIHQTGDAQEYKDFDRLQNLRETFPKRLKERYVLTKFIEPQHVGDTLQEADLVVARCGINTITELMFFEKVALLIPLPFSQRNEQIKNALFLKNLGLAEVAPQKSLDSKRFLELIAEMFHNIDIYKRTSQVDIALHKEASKKIVEVIRDVVKEKKK